MDEVEEFEPREDTTVIRLDVPPPDLGVDQATLSGWTGGPNPYLPRQRVPPVTSKHREEDGHLWALRADVVALAAGKDLAPPAEVHDDLRRVYVIELTHCPEAAHAGKTCVYVGQSWHPARARFIQHLVGYKAGRGHVRKWGTHLRPELYSRLAACETHAESEALERSTAQELERQGYAVHGVRSS